MTKKYSQIEKLKVNAIIYLFKLLLFVPMKYKIKLALFVEAVLFFLAKHGVLKAMQKRYAISMINLRLCFPHKSDKVLWKILRASFRESTLTYLNYGYVFCASASKIQDDINYVSESNLFDKVISDANVIAMVPHFCAFDIGLNRIATDTSYCSIYKKVDSYFFEKLKEARSGSADKSYNSELFTIEDGLRVVIKSMIQNKHVLFYLPDLDHGLRNSVFVKFFAQENCAILRIVPKIARMTNAVIVPVISYRKRDKYMVKLLSSFYMPEHIDSINDVSYITQSICKMISMHPSQYRWYYPIFTTQPNLPDGILYKNAVEKVFY